MEDKFDQVLRLINPQSNQFASQFDRDRLSPQPDGLQGMNIPALGFGLTGTTPQVAADDVLSR